MSVAEPAGQMGEVGLLIPTGVQQPLDVLAAQSEIDDGRGWQVFHGGQQFADHIFQFGPLGTCRRGTLSSVVLSSSCRI